MQTGMLGNSEALRQVWDGPLKDLVIKLNGEDGEEVLTELNKFNRREPCWVEENSVVEVAAPTLVAPNLRDTGPTLGEWLKAREDLHKFLTGESIILRDIFALTEEVLASTIHMPAFRPAGATNRMAVEWKKKLGVKVHEVVGVMRYKNSTGLEKPNLSIILRHVRPDGDYMSADGYISMKEKLWLGLFGWCDADTLHFAITTEHLDSAEISTCFPEDRLSWDMAAFGRWDREGNRVEFYRGCVNETISKCYARSARKVPLRS